VSGVFIDVVCPDCGAKLRGQLVTPLDGGPNLFTDYPHRARRWKGWCRKGCWTHNTLDFGGAA
jgi:hypothetical protein